MMDCPSCSQIGVKATVPLGHSLRRCLRCLRDVRENISRVPIKLEGMQNLTDQERADYRQSLEEILTPTRSDILETTKKGKVILCCIHNRTVMAGVDVQLLAVGKPKGDTYFRWWTHEPGLAPTKALVTFTKENNRGGHLPGWFDRYTESLLKEWGSRKDFKIAFKKLLGYLKEGKTVAVACYCHPMKREVCHLSILADLVRDFGYEVEEAELNEV